MVSYNSVRGEIYLVRPELTALISRTVSLEQVLDLY